MQNDNELLNGAIFEARKLRELAMENGRHSLKKFLKEEKLPLDDFAQAELDLDDLVDLIIKRSKENQCTHNKDDNEEQEEDEFGYDSRGRPYLNNMFNKRRHNTETEIEERARNGMHGSLTDKDEYDFSGDIDDDDIESDDEQNLSDELTKENVCRWNILTNAKTSPARIGVPKISESERRILLKHSGLLNRSKDNRLIKEVKDDKDFLQKRSGIKKTGVAKRVINDIEIKQQLLK